MNAHARYVKIGCVAIAVPMFGLSESRDVRDVADVEDSQYMGPPVRT